MASTYVNNLRLNEMATGDGAGTWGTTTNTNLELIGEALGYGTEAITTNADTHTSTVADGSTDAARAMYIKYTGTLDSACTITIGPNTMKRVQFIENATSGSQNIIISQGSGANITIPPGDVKVVYLDGAGSGAAVVDAFASLSVVDLKVQDDLTVTDDLIVNGDIDLEGNMDVNGSLETDALSLNGTTVTSTAAEINLLDGSSANTVVNSKAVIYGSSGEVAGTLSTAAQPNITSVGTLTGLDVAGTPTFDGLTVDGDATLSDSTNSTLQLKGLATAGSAGDSIGRIDWYGSAPAGNGAGIKAAIETSATTSTLRDFDLLFKTSQNVGSGEPTNSLKVAATGDISFYDDTGTSQALFWDASAESLGIGVTSPNVALEVDGGTANGSIARFHNENTRYLEISAESDGTYDDAISVFKKNTSVGQFAFRNSTTEYMRIDSSGNVGIGTDSPASKLHVAGDGDTASKITAERTGSTTGTNVLGYDYIGTFSNTALRLFANSSEKMRIDSSGNVGIGTTSPSTALHIYNTGARPVTIGNASATWSLGTSSTNFAIRENSSSSDYVTINSLGQVGIGTSSPDVYGVHASQSSNSVYYKAVSGTVASIYGSASALGTALVGTTSNHSVSFYSNNSEKMRIDASGNVGIGTSSPETRLHISGGDPSIRLQAGSTADARIDFEDSLGNVRWYSGYDVSSGNIVLAADESGFSSGVTVQMDNSGNVGIGTGSITTFGGYKTLHFKNTGGDAIQLNETDGGVINQILCTDGSGGKVLLGTRSNHVTVFCQNDIERARIDTSGRFLVGATSAASGFKLQVDGGAGNARYTNIDTGGSTFDQFRFNDGLVGSITTNGVTTAFNTSSDARLKDVTGSARGLEVINELNPVAYNWKESGQADEGLIAQEVLDIVPNAVSGSEEDMYSMDYSKLVVHLVAGMKEQQAQIEALQSEINELKNS